MSGRKKNNGQIWIERNNPYNLKYHVNNKDYIVKTEALYNIASDKSIEAGTVVKLDSNNGIVEAQFPNDINNVIGVVVSTRNEDLNKRGQTSPIAISQIGYIEIYNPGNVFQSSDDYTLTAYDVEKKTGKLNNGYTEKTIIGAPVYWYIGRTDTSGVYSYAEKDYGKLTLGTPAGYENNCAGYENQDPNLNVDYNNLPMIGNVTKVKCNENTITYMEVHLNFTAFDTSLEWSYPNKNVLNLTEPLTNGKEIKICHGLFPTNLKNIQCDTSVFVNNEKVIAPVVNTLNESGGYTSVYIKADGSINDIKITGTVSYNL